MNSFDIIGMALKNLWRRKVRTILTVFGVIIGTAAIVLVLSLSIGMNESFKQQISQMGSLTVINVDTYYRPEIEAAAGEVVVATSFSRRQQNNVTLDDKALEAIKSIEGVVAVTPMLSTSARLHSGKYEAYVQIIGVNAETMEHFGYEVEQGRLLAANDSSAVVFGSNIKRNFYNPRSRSWYSREEPNIDVMNDKITITFDMGYYYEAEKSNRRNREQELDVVGVLKDGNYDYAAFMNVEHLKKLLKANSRTSNTPGRISYGSNTNTDSYEQVMVKVEKLEDVERVQQTIKEMGFGASSLTDILRQMMDQTKTIRTILSAIGGVALFIAAIGITNTMIMSIYERTREIGIMKVLGCILRDIRKLFLLESALIGFIGGLIGIGFSYATSILMNKAGISFLNIGWYSSSGPSKISIIPIWLALAAIIFASFVGIVSGFYPAVRAMRLSPLEAIRNE
ncbi:MAG: ABC transporter permease [Clostridiaceae bacterium]|jgi:putative ABC transport system permease protein|nr:ABC transporter permease [Clostridiaceae bacterium]